MARKPCNWQADGGPAETVVARAGAMGASIAWIVEDTTNIYKSIDMKSGFDNESLLRAHQLLSALLQLDPRGGIFCQRQMCDALQLAVSAHGKTAQWVQACLQVSAEPSDVYATTAFKMRVMLSHCRIKHDNKTGTETNEQFAQLWKIMTENRDAPPTKKSRRQARLESRPNPFMAFRAEAEGEDEAEAPEEKIVVTKWFDGTRAVLLYASGEVTHADVYRPGPNGFVEALWLGEKTVLELELPNARCADGHLLEALPEAKKAKHAAERGQAPSGKSISKKPAGSTSCALEMKLCRQHHQHI